MARFALFIFERRVDAEIDETMEPMRPGILVLTQVYPPALAALEREFHVHKLWLARDRAALLTSVADRIRGVVTTGLVGFDSDLVSALPCLEIVACFVLGRIRWWIWRWV